MEKRCQSCGRLDDDDLLTFDGLCWSCDLDEDPVVEERHFLEMMEIFVQIRYAMEKDGDFKNAS